jgi:hypothetical protein
MGNTISKEGKHPPKIDLLLSDSSLTPMNLNFIPSSTCSDADTDYSFETFEIINGPKREKSPAPAPAPLLSLEDEIEVSTEISPFVKKMLNGLLQKILMLELKVNEQSKTIVKQQKHNEALSQPIVKFTWTKTELDFAISVVENSILFGIALLAVFIR